MQGTVNACGDIVQPLTDTGVVTITALTLDTTGSKCRNIDATGFWETVADDARAFPCNDATMGNLEYCDEDNLNCATPAARADLVSSGETMAETRRVRITMTGQLANDANVTKTMSSSITVANVLLLTEP
jgi:hypothetical protein